MTNILPDDYYTNLLQQQRSRAAAPSTSPAAAPVAPAPSAPSVTIETPSPFTPTRGTTVQMVAPKGPGYFDQPPTIKLFGDDLSPEEQAAKFGGHVGSPEYYKYQSERGVASRLPRELSSAFGVKLPEQEEWDALSFGNKAATLYTAANFAAARMVRDFPKFAAKATLGVGLTAIKPVYNLLTGKPSDATSLAKEEKVSLPWVGEIPTLYQTREDAMKSGMGPIASTVFAGSAFVLDTASLFPVSETLVNSFRPRGSTAAPGVVRNTEPIKTAIEADGRTVAKAPSASEYYSMPKTEASQFGGNANTVRWKFTPASADGGMNVSVVKSVKGKQPGEFVKTEFGLKKVEQGDFGPEVRLYSADVPVSGPKVAAAAGDETADALLALLPKERKGLANRAITPEQISIVNRIGAVKEIPSEVTQEVVKALTGKSAVADLTEQEFVRVSQSLAKWGGAYGTVEAASMGPTGFARMWASPQRHFFDYVEDKFGLPVKSQLYVPMERAQRLSRSLTSTLDNELDTIFGKYGKAKYVEERRLIDAYLRGDTAALTANTAIDAAAKAELIEIAKKLKAWDDTYGEVLGVGREAYLAEYGGPKIADVGGTVPQYKNLEQVPVKEFFAKFKRKGSVETFIDDPLASRQIYAREGARALHFGPVLKDFKEMSKELPNNIFRHANSYVQEKLGKLGAAEQFIDSFVPAVNKKFGLNLPADVSRQAINYGLSSMYSGLVGTPKAIFQQFFQLPLFVYSRLGTKFAGEAFRKSFVKAERDRIAKGGWLNDISLPYGSELAKEFNPSGKALNLFKRGTQATIKPMTIVDNDIRIKTFLQAEMQWNEALNLYNKGAIRWSELEQRLDFGAFSKADQNIIRKNLLSGKTDDAFNTYMQEILDETSFPYRTGSGARVGYGLAGKLGTGLLNYTIESTNVLGRWVATGQWDKVLRFAGNMNLLNGTLKETFDVNFKDVIYQKPYGVLSPVFGLVGDAYSMMMGVIENNRQNFNEARNDVLRTLQSGQPAGIVRRNLNLFMKSLKAGDNGTGRYPIYDESGRLIREGDFTDLFWGTLMGFPTVEKVGERELYNDMRNRQTEVSEVQQQINQLLREGKFDEMEKLIEETGILPSQSAMESYYTPRTMRLYENLRAQQKAEFAPRVFEELQ